MEVPPPHDDRVIPLKDSKTALDSFQAESDLPSSGPARWPTSSSTEATTIVRAEAPFSPPDAPPISLAEVESTGTQLEWDEAVAVAQALCQVFLLAQLRREIVAKPDGGDRAALTLSDVFIDSAGRINIAKHAPRTVATAIECIGTVVSQLLPREDPLGLRARIVARATSVPPFYNSLEELSRALAAYERWSWSDLIRAVYERAKDRRRLAAPALAAAAKPGKRKTAAPKAASVSALSGRNEYVWFGAAVAAVLIVVVGVGLWLVLGRRSSSPAAAKAGAPATDSGQPSAEKSAEDLPPSGATRGAVAAPALPSKDGKSGAVAAGTGVSVEASSVVRDRSDAPPSRDVVGDSGSTPSPAVGDSSTGRAAALEGRIADRSVPNRTYDAEDRDVVPPIVVIPQLLGVLSPTSPGVRRETVTIAVVVNERGTVESVKAVNDPQSIGESVILAAALSNLKSWRFQPATKEGTPVKYRQIFPLDAVRRLAPPSAFREPAAQADPAR